MFFPFPPSSYRIWLREIFVHGYLQVIPRDCKSPTLKLLLVLFQQISYNLHLHFQQEKRYSCHRNQTINRTLTKHLVFIIQLTIWRLKKARCNSTEPSKEKKAKKKKKGATWPLADRSQVITKSVIYQGFKVNVVFYTQVQLSDLTMLLSRKI